VDQAQRTPQARSERRDHDALIRRRRAFLARQQRGAVAGRDQAPDRVVEVQLDARLRLFVGCGEPVHRHAMQPCAGVIDDQRAGGKPGRCDRAWQRPRAWQKGHHRVAAPGHDLQPLNGRLRQCHQADVQRALLQAGQGFLRREHRNLYIMSAGQVAQARADGLLVELQDKTGFMPRAAPTVEAKEETSNERNARLHAEHIAAFTPTAPNADIEAMRATLKAGVQVVSAPQLFPTPSALAARMVRLAGLAVGMRVLEPRAFAVLPISRSRSAAGFPYRLRCCMAAEKMN
jgi:hypothetical protein